MEARSLKITRWMTHSLIAVASCGVLAVTWELKEALDARANLEETQFQARSRLEAIKEKSPFRTIHRALEKVQTDEASEKLSRLDRTMKGLEKELGIKRGEELEKIFMQHRSLIQEATAFSRPDELLTTLSDKVTGLSQLARTRRWQNVERLAERMEQRLDQLRASARVESPLVRYMESDLAQLTHLVKGSSLDEDNKNEVLRQLEGIRQEIAMLMDLHQSRRGMQTELLQIDAAMNRWAARADLAIGTLKHRAQQAVEMGLTHLWGLGALLLCGWGVLGVLWSMARRGQRRSQDQDMLEMLIQGVLGDRPVQHLIGPARSDEAQAAIRVIKKRLHLGEDFQAAMPFGSVLIDVEGKLVWGNALFCEQFGLESDALTDEIVLWQQVAQRLTGPENDPVMTAIESMEPGTWQVQLQMEDGVSVPLEMHVSPLEVKQQRKVLVVFYPLSLMRETIQSQARLIMEPVRQALEALEAETWGLEAEARLAPLWKQAGLSEDWEKLSRVIHRMDQARNELLLQIQQMEDENHDHLKTVVDLSQGLEVRARALKTQMQGLKDIRDSLVSIDQLGADLAMEHAALLASTRSQLKRQDVLTETARGLGERMLQAKDAVAALEKYKQDYRAGKQEIQETKHTMVHLHNRFLGTLPALSEKSEELAAEMKEALIRLDRATAGLETRLTGLDVQITKLAMNFAGPVPEIERLSQGVDLAAHERVAREIRQAMQEDQELIIERLKKVVEDLRQDAQGFASLREELSHTALPVNTDQA